MKLLWLPNGIILNELISGWNIDPCDRQVIGPRHMEIDSYEIKPELGFIIHFLPYDFIKTEVIPSTNRYPSKQSSRWSDMNLDGFLHVLENILPMEVIEIHGPWRLHWEMKGNSLFPSLEYGKVMSLKGFESILWYLQFSNKAYPDQQILDF